MHSGRKAALQAVITPLDLPRGWVAVDTGVRAAPSPGTEVEVPDRARALASEGVAWFASVDRDRRTDYDSAIDTLNLASPLRRLPGGGTGTTVELLGHRDDGSFETRWKRWLEDLGEGRKRTGVGSAGSDGLSGDAPWGARSLVFTGDGPATADGVMNAIRAGRVVVSDGPFIDFRLGGKRSATPS